MIFTGRHAGSHLGGVADTSRHHPMRGQRKEKSPAGRGRHCSGIGRAAGRSGTGGVGCTIIARQNVAGGGSLAQVSGDLPPPTTQRGTSRQGASRAVCCGGTHAPLLSTHHQPIAVTVCTRTTADPASAGANRVASEWEHCVGLVPSVPRRPIAPRATAGRAPMKARQAPPPRRAQIHAPKARPC